MFKWLKLGERNPTATGIIVLAGGMVVMGSMPICGMVVVICGMVLINDRENAILEAK